MNQKDWTRVLSPYGFALSESLTLEGSWPKKNNSSFFTLLGDDDILAVYGKDAVKFLQGQTTCDVQKLAEGCTVLGACCTLKGRMIANFRLFKISEELLYLSIPKGQAIVFIAGIQKYMAFYRADIKIINSWIRFGVIINSDDQQELVNLFENKQFLFSITPSFSAEKVRTELWVKEEQSMDLFHTLASTYTLVPSDVWKLMDIENGIGWITPDITEKLIPQECNLDKIEGISFKKGCYTGQEIVARLHYRGKAKTRLQYFLSSHPAMPGDKVINDKGRPCGQVINSVMNPETNDYHMLASVRIDQIDGYLSVDNSPLTLQFVPYSLDD